MPLTDYNAMFYDHMPRSELLRRLSTHSSSVSSSGRSRKNSTRVTKQTSAGNSPHIVQRRRTTPAHTARACPRNSPFQTREERLRNYYSSRSSMSFARPMSWQPGSETIQTPATQVPMSEPAVGNTIAGMENLAVSGTPESSVQQSIENAFAMGYGYTVSKPTSTYQQSPTGNDGYEAYGLASESTYHPYLAYNVSAQPQYPYMPQAPIYDMSTSVNYQLPQYSQAEPDYTIAAQAPQKNLDYLSMACPATKPPKTSTRTRLQLPRRRSKELIGMGLYDDEDKKFMSTLNSAFTDDPNRNSMGKGLKLEETWEPPKDDEDDENDEQEEGYSSDEVEEVDEIPPVQGTAPSGIQTAFYPPYGDLSNQSFFFSEDNEYTDDDQYTNYMAYGPGLQDSQPKLQGPATRSFVWL
ncbi:hypothetical protein ABVK25_006168 [Lepraria finkii]|uniref:Uncharacterized protein n=1 Tax=Lepraria finkii TaxID=1340010 RepID=A0ABR4B6N0_9LECA